MSQLYSEDRSIMSATIGKASKVLLAGRASWHCMCRARQRARPHKAPGAPLRLGPLKVLVCLRFSGCMEEHIHIHVYIYIHTYTYTSTFVHIYEHAYLYVYTHVFMYVYIHICVVYIYTYVYT